MITYNFKFIIFSIILGTLSLIYYNDSNGLYKNIYYTNVVLVTTKFRTLAELLYEPTTNHRNENNKLKEFTKTNETKCKKSIYPKDDKKPNDQIQQVPENENIGTPNTVKYRKGTHSKEKDAISNRSSRSLKYLEMQRKLYNNFYVRPEIYFQNLSDKSNDKYFEYSNKKKSSNKVNDEYLDALKTSCVGGAEVCEFSSILTGSYGVTAALKTAGVTNAKDITTAATLLSSSLEKFFVGASWGTFFHYGIAAFVLILIVVALIILYLYLRKKRKNSWKHECKKHLCT
ncbi:stevor PIR protein,putative [Plasmodium sp.]|nr:stevor PIR protein,putative [Plasmodium sp.]